MRSLETWLTQSPTERLEYATAQQDILAVKWWLLLDIDPTKGSYQYNSALRSAIKSNNTELLEVICSNKYTQQFLQTEEGIEEVLVVAIQSSNIESLSYILEQYPQALEFINAQPNRILEGLKSQYLRSSWGGNSDWCKMQERRQLTLFNYLLTLPSIRDNIHAHLSGILCSYMRQGTVAVIKRLLEIENAGLHINTNEVVEQVYDAAIRNKPEKIYHVIPYLTPNPRLTKNNNFLIRWAIENNHPKITRTLTKDDDVVRMIDQNTPNEDFFRICGFGFHSQNALTYCFAAKRRECFKALISNPDIRRKVINNPQYSQWMADIIQAERQSTVAQVLGVKWLQKKSNPTLNNDALIHIVSQNCMFINQRDIEILLHIHPTLLIHHAKNNINALFENLDNIFTESCSDVADAPLYHQQNSTLNQLRLLRESREDRTATQKLQPAQKTNRPQ